MSTKCPRFYPRTLLFLFHSRAFHVKIKLLRKNRLVVDRHLFLQSRQFRLYKRFYFVQRTEADAKAGAGNSIGRPLSLSPPSSFSYCVPLLLLTPAADLICRYLNGEAEIHAVRRHRARNEGRRLGHGADFLLPESQQSALLPPIVTRAHAAEERQTRRSQSPDTPRPEDHEHSRDLRERRRRI